MENPWRVGIVMEFISTTLRKSIENDNRLKDIMKQINIGKQIASGMNFLHSLNPYILVKIKEYHFIFHFIFTFYFYF